MKDLDINVINAAKKELKRKASVLEEAKTIIEGMGIKQRRKRKKKASAKGK